MTSRIKISEAHGDSLDDLYIPNRAWGGPPAHTKHSNRFLATSEGPDEVKSIVLKQHVSGLHVPAYVTDEETEAQRWR